MTKQQSSVWSFMTDFSPYYTYWNDAFTAEECDKIIEIGKSAGLYSGTISKGQGEFHTEKQYRDSNISFIYPLGNEWLFQKMSAYVLDLNKNFYNYDLFGFVEGFQFTEYVAPTGKYNEHIDRMVNGIVRKLSVVVQLTDPEKYEGGEIDLIMSKDPETLGKQRGNLYMFPSHYLHRVRPVVEGTRHSLVAWVSGPPFR